MAITVRSIGNFMNNKTLAAINLLCIAFPMLLGVIEAVTNKPANQLAVSSAGLFMIVFGIWTSVRLSKQPD
jgi:hypothetical protein